MSRLSRDPELLVRPLSSSRQAALAAPDAVGAGARLNVEGVLEGTLQHADGRIRATMQLVRVADRRVLWSGSVEEEESEAFLLEDSIADRLVRALGITSPLTAAGRDARAVRAARPTRRTCAEDTSGIGGTARISRSPQAEFEDAIRQDPAYALAYAGLADA